MAEARNAKAEWVRVLVDGLYFCDTDKNTGCPKTYCYQRGGFCRRTRHIEYAYGSAKLLSKAEIMESCGAGYLEIWTEEDERVIEECAWCKGNIINWSGDARWSNQTNRLYNKTRGFRVWRGMPTDEEREAVKWE